MKIFKEELKHIRNFIFDIDGVFTDGSILIHEDGSMLRTMNTKDGYAVKAALHAGFVFALYLVAQILLFKDSMIWG